MNDQELVELLLSNYSEQYRLYQALLQNLHAGLPRTGEAPDLPRILKVLQERNRTFDTIKALDERIQRNKIGWDRRKNELHSVSAETLKTLLRNIADILGKVMETNTRLEEALSQRTGKSG
ncbi:MAG: hypothetical protein A2293_00650 [Elusimicrobia bacterium RIFOXYB2_FULL_49_7]|nr:MAG: hypothetical protein A2293_00650 [Elusimicrobia bacterium RIFOXYB2_FULL_49_7]